VPRPRADERTRLEKRTPRSARQAAAAPPSPSPRDAGRADDDAPARGASRAWRLLVVMLVLAVLARDQLVGTSRLVYDWLAD
jgi:hypothetical protein